MKRYENYKDSGEQWLGQVPSHWEIKRLGSYFTERRVKVSDKDYEPLSVTKLGVFPQWENVAKTNDGENRKLVKAGDFVINSRSDRRGSSGVSDRDGSVSLINIVLQPRHNIYSRFCNYLLKSHAFIEEYYRNGRGIVADLWTTRYDEMKLIKLVLPPIEEQILMCDYLDSITTEIDKAIAQQQRMIVLLNERKQIIIQNAVTKGLDPNVPMKDSGVDYIGQIPATWELKKIKYLASYNDEALPENTKKDTEIDYVEIGDVSFGQGITNSTKYLFGDAPSRARRITKKGDIIISTVRTYLKAVAVIDKDDLIVSTGFMVIRPNTRMIDGRFMSYAVLASSLINEIEKISVGTSYPAVNAWQAADLKIAYPNSKEEQERIADYLFKVESYVEIAINRHKMAIDVLQERKRIIINDVVTGKIKVL